MSKNILIVPDQWYVGYKNTGDELLSFMIPWDKKPTAAMEKRKETVDRWAKEYRDRVSKKATVENNNPQTGFKFVDVARRCRTNNAFLRILDPRGFIAEISIENVLWIMDRVTIKNGEILEPCVWAKWKKDQYNTIVPTTHPDYLQAIADTKKLKEKKTYLKESDIQIGDNCVLHNEDEMIYHGKMRLKVHQIYRNYNYYSPNDMKEDIKETQEEFYVFVENGRFDDGSWITYKIYRRMPKILSVKGKGTLRDLKNYKHGYENPNEPDYKKKGRYSTTMVMGGKQFFPEDAEKYSKDYYSTHYYEEVVGFVQ